LQWNQIHRIYRAVHSKVANELVAAGTNAWLIGFSTDLSRASCSHHFDMLSCVRDRFSIPAAAVSRRQLMQLGGTTLASAILRARSLDDKPATSDLKIDKIEFTELTGHYQSESGLT
jgi:hypothetical protein